MSIDINELMVQEFTVCNIQGTNFDILVQTPGKLASPQPMPQLIIPAKKYLWSFPFTWNTEGNITSPLCRCKQSRFGNKEEQEL